jgi:hypothetical protein
MTRLDLLKRVQKRKKQIGLTIDNIAKLSNNSALWRYFFILLNLIVL